MRIDYITVFEVESVKIQKVAYTDSSGRHQEWYNILCDNERVMVIHSPYEKPLPQVELDPQIDV